MIFSKFVIWRTLSPFILLAALFGGFLVYSAFRDSDFAFVGFIPAAVLIVAFFVWFGKYGYCPECRAKIGKRIGKACSNCGHEFQKDDIV